MFEIVGDIRNIQVIATGRGIRRLKNPRKRLGRSDPQAEGGGNPTAGKEIWVAVHTKKDAGRLGNRILREAGVE